MPRCPNEYKDSAFIGPVCADVSISHHLIYSHERVFENSMDITSFTGHRATKRGKKSIKKRMVTRIKKRMVTRIKKRMASRIKKRMASRKR